MFEYSEEALSLGKWLGGRERGAPWRPDVDNHWSSLAGKPFGFKAARLFVKSDLKELCTTLGFASTATALAPCCICQCDHTTWTNLQELSPLGHGWPMFDFEAYDAACKRCERPVKLNRAQYSKVRQLLDFDRRKGGARGRALTEAIPELGLAKGDRLEPSVSLPIVSNFDSMRPEIGGNIEVMFWRRSEETRVRHRNPLISESLSPHRALGVDWQHGFSLGVFAYFINGFVYQLIEASTFAPAASTIAVRKLNVCSELQRRMATWKETEDRCNRPRTLPNNMTSGMLGAKGDTVGLGAAEANDMLEFLVKEIFDKRVAPFEGELWRHWGEAGHRLLAIRQFFARCKANPPLSAVQDQHVNVDTQK